ncbi:hypothetical protein LSTR_LSTR015149 [Laodelphax striatellus]|uniref:Uncharacterized protein n=1 Tax=Laodelphax striatellus TaxID=195883 RepID=A0A482WH82_LAOST|nr:hypothetical protein LSTR_LSTR015149 [Laodelphax striatellus]
MEIYCERLSSLRSRLNIRTSFHSRSCSASIFDADPLSTATIAANAPFSPLSDCVCSQQAMIISLLDDVSCQNISARSFNSSVLL